MHLECYHPVAGHLLHSLTDHFAEAESAEMLRQMWNSGMQGRKLFCIFLTGGKKELGDCMCSWIAAAQWKQGFRRGSKGEKHLEMAHA